MNTIVAPVVVFLGAPLLAVLLSLATTHARLLHGLNLATMTGLVVSEIALIQQVLAHGPQTALWGLVYIDALSAFILFIVTFIGLACSLYTWTYLDDYMARGMITPKRLSRFFVLFHGFLLAMIVATMANSLGVLWVAIEGTTLATTFLIAFFQKREGLEAGWKYLILCSVGIALALFGTVLTYYSSVRVLGDESTALNVTKLLEVAGQLDPHVLKLAFIFLFVGYGTKIGLAPMHAWVPEAYSEAPAPVTAMLAGVLETVAVYAVLRSKAIMDQALPPAFTGNLLVLFGLISFVVAALFILIQRDYKRLFAYSSVEHMGLAMIGFGVGGPWEHSVVCSICSTMHWRSRWRFSRRGTCIAGMPPVKSARCGDWRTFNRSRRWRCSSQDWPWSGCRRSRCLPARSWSYRHWPLRVLPLTRCIWEDSLRSSLPTMCAVSRLSRCSSCLRWPCSGASPIAWSRWCGAPRRMA